VPRRRVIGLFGPRPRVGTGGWAEAFVGDSLTRYLFIRVMHVVMMCMMCCVCV